MKKFKYKGVVFLLQAYEKNVFASVCIPEGGCFALDFKNKKFESFLKHTNEEKRLQNEKIKEIINVADIQLIIENLFE